MIPQKTRIAIISHTHPSISKGGAEISAYTLFLGLQKLGLDPYFIAACPRDQKSRLEFNSPTERVIFYDPAYYDHFYHIAPKQVADELAFTLDELGVGIANFHHFMNFGLNGIRMASRRVPRTVVTLHEFLAICHHHGQMVTRPHRRLCDSASASKCVRCFPEHERGQFQYRQDFFMKAFSRVASFISPSNFLADRFVDWGLPAERIRVIENGLADKPQRVPHRPKDPSEPWVFGYFGQINPFKGVDIILDAAEFVRAKPQLARRVIIRIHGNIIGQAQEFIDKFEADVKRNIALEYAGPYDNTQVTTLMRACDYVVMASRWWENSPVVIQEAYAAGRPVIASNIGGMAEKVKPGVSGLHFQVGNAASLADAIETACDPRVSERLQVSVPDPSDARQMAEQYLRVFREGTMKSAPALAAIAAS